VAAEGQAQVAALVPTAAETVALGHQTQGCNLVQQTRAAAQAALLTVLLVIKQADQAAPASS
tara:strand:- start:206 stop:391 length:186 start_codon:yes stop_codon:yes gene_type:complete